MSISKVLELYARSGRSLIDNGLNEAALPIAVAETALELFAQQRWRVLGGDVYHLTEDGRFESTYEDWFYEGDDVDASITVARDFIRSLNGRTGYVVFVVAEK
ncbi:hypothetical protein [Paraburkholderia pallida]|uniref:Immunity protein 40 domain-containing protein n=1 Tax=Paraburkholderia pallida TaxID=2547399 RepID=A0A4P7CY64_9BURK|nr:hypothetical protein [Paraburkholderia pallida]QBR00418.1 hypothetical protein E1956_25580 [Paraburkholderia pallida]